MKLSHPYKVILSGHNGALQSPPIGLISPTHSTFQFQVSLLIQYYTLPVSQTSLLSIDLSCVIHHLISCMSKWHVNPYSSVEEDERKEMASLFGGRGGSMALSSCRCTVELSWVGCICLGEKLGVTHDCNVLILLGFTEFTIIYFFVFVSWILLKNIKMFFLSNCGK